MVAEAPLERNDSGLYPAGEGWFVVNAREAQWFDSNGLGFYTPFEGENARFSQLGFNIGILRPGEPSCMYHAEGAQEDFLVLSGECLLIVEGQERHLKAWDFVHCPPMTRHVFVGAGDGPCLAAWRRRPYFGTCPGLPCRRGGARVTARASRRRHPKAPRRTPATDGPGRPPAHRSSREADQSTCSTMSVDMVESSVQSRCGIPLGQRTC